MEKEKHYDVVQEYCDNRIKLFKNIEYIAYALILLFSIFLIAGCNKDPVIVPNNNPNSDVTNEGCLYNNPECSSGYSCTNNECIKIENITSNTTQRTISKAKSLGHHSGGGGGGGGSSVPLLIDVGGY